MNVANLPAGRDGGSPTGWRSAGVARASTTGSSNTASAPSPGWLREIGAAPGGRVVLYLRQLPDLLTSLFVTFWAGSTTAPTNSRLTEDELAFLIADAVAPVRGDRRGVTPPSHDERPARRALSRCAWWGTTSITSSPPPSSQRRMRPTSMTATPPWIFYTSGTTGKTEGGDAVPRRPELRDRVVARRPDVARRTGRDLAQSPAQPRGGLPRAGRGGHGARTRSSPIRSASMWRRSSSSSGTRGSPTRGWCRPRS